jgi:NADPH-dependent ferric siderophore reductase
VWTSSRARTRSGFSYAATRRHCPAIAAILESPPAQRELIAVVEVADGGEEQQLELPPGARLEWVHRDGAPAATTAHLADALREIDLPGRSGPGVGCGRVTSRARPQNGPTGRTRHPRSHSSAKGYWLRSGDWLDDED